MVGYPEVAQKMALMPSSPGGFFIRGTRGGTQNIPNGM